MKRDNKYVVRIGESTDPQLVGGKGASLSRMKSIGLRVPDGITITTQAWKEWKSGDLTIAGLYDEFVRPSVEKIFPRLGMRFSPKSGAGQAVSVRSGSAQSMPGMMETVLNVGATGANGRLSYLMSLIRAKGLDETVVSGIVDRYLLAHGTFFVEGVNSDSLVGELADYAGVSFEDDVHTHIRSAIELVFESWDSPKAKSYRKLRKIPNTLGTACTIQLMVDATNFGFSGVMLTRGSIDWLPSSQGDAVVDGSHNVFGRDKLMSSHKDSYTELVKAGNLLEQAYHDAMDVEFTHDGDSLYFLQCRPAKRTPVDAMRLAVQLYDDYIFSPEQVMAVPVVDDSFTEYEVVGGEHLGTAIPINGKLITGAARLNPDFKCGPDDIAFREITTTSDIDLMTKCRAVVTLLGGPTCHAALVASELNTTVFVGVGGIVASYSKGYVWSIGYKKLRDGEIITILPNGQIYRGEVEASQVVRKGEWSARLAKYQDDISRGLDNRKGPELETEEEKVEKPIRKTRTRAKIAGEMFEYSGKAKSGKATDVIDLKPIPF